MVDKGSAVYEAVNKESRANFFIGMHNEFVGTRAPRAAMFVCFKQADEGGEFMIRYSVMELPFFSFLDSLPDGLQPPAASAVKGLVSAAINAKVDFDVKMQWIDGDGGYDDARTLQARAPVQPPAVLHPKTGEPTWFCNVHSHSAKLRKSPKIYGELFTDGASQINKSDMYYGDDSTSTRPTWPTWTRYYDGSPFHRVIRGFMVQTGDPTGSGKGGASIWGGAFGDEFHAENRHDRRGVLAMANKGPGTNRSQFFFTFDAQPHLNDRYTVFGRLIDGFDALDALEKLPVGKKNRPTTDVRIERVTIHANPRGAYAVREPAGRGGGAAVRGRGAVCESCARDGGLKARAPMRRLLVLLVVAASAGASAGASDDGPGDAVVAAIRAAGGYVDHRQEIVELAPGYRGVVARRAIDAGAVLARIPCYDPALPDAWSSLDNVAKLPPRDWRRHSAWFDAKCRPGGAADGADDRALHLVVGRAGAGQGVHFMAPLYDLYNHRNGRHHNTRVHVDAGVEVKVVAHREIAAGEELYNSYGRSAPDMFRDYGFVEADPQTWDLVPDFPFEADLARRARRPGAAATREPPADAKPARPPLRRGELGGEL
ncbi:TauD/TfdA-like taurine catabolism dioxygenase [Aureococcus anophagefferens]|nr:TauD/TfdA-like taurine catabolism dioxygenase [Aureococcus anophagefferens]